MVSGAAEPSSRPFRSSCRRVSFMASLLTAVTLGQVTPGQGRAQRLQLGIADLGRAKGGHGGTPVAHRRLDIAPPALLSRFGKGLGDLGADRLVQGMAVGADLPIDLGGLAGGRSEEHTS